MPALLPATLADSNAPLYLILGWFGFVLFVLLVVVAGSVFWVWMLVDAIKNPRLNDNDRIIWVLVVVLLHFVGAVVYFFVARDPRPGGLPT